jgi:hypothetical protein
MASTTSQHHRHAGIDRFLRPAGFLERAADLDAVAGRQLRAQIGQLSVDGHRHVGRLHAVDDVGAHGKRQLAAAPPEDRLLERFAHRRHLGHRHGAARGGRHLHRQHALEGVALGFRRAQHDVDQAVVLAELRQGDAADGALQGARDAGGGYAEGARLVLVDIDAQHRRAHAPVVVHVQGVGRGAHRLRHLVGNRLDALDVGADDAELQRVGHRRAQRDAIGARAHAGKLLGEQLAQALRRCVRALPGPS